MKYAISWKQAKHQNLLLFIRDCALDFLFGLGMVSAGILIYIITPPY